MSCLNRLALCACAQVGARHTAAIAAERIPKVFTTIAIIGSTSLTWYEDRFDRLSSALDRFTGFCSRVFWQWTSSRRSVDLARWEALLCLPRLQLDRCR